MKSKSKQNAPAAEPHALTPWEPRRSSACGWKAMHRAGFVLTAPGRAGAAPLSRGCWRPRPLGVVLLLRLSPAGERPESTPGKQKAGNVERKQRIRMTGFREESLHSLQTR